MAAREIRFSQTRAERVGGCIHVRFMCVCEVERQGEAAQLNACIIIMSFCCV